MKSKPINKLLSFSEQDFQKFVEIKNLKDFSTYSDCLAFLIDSTYSKVKHTASVDRLANIENDIEKLLMIAKENNSMIYQERDGINTLLHFYEVQEFHSADNRLSDSEPHDVMSRSNDNYKSIVHQRSVDKGADSLQDEQSD